jgi:uncharacterized protein YneF (UPF0154 family)
MIMPISLEPKTLLAYFLVALCTGAGWSLGVWIVRRILG